MGQSLSRRGFLRTLGLGTAALAMPRRADPAPAPKPNILFIMSDDHAAHAKCCYGSRINNTPQIDRNARDGMRFDRAFGISSLCAPSRAIILTSKYSQLNGVTDNRRVFDGSQLTFPKLLQKAGYQTALVGKWHLKSAPTGFDYWNVLPGQGRYNDPQFIEMGRRRTYKGYVTDIITDQALRWLGRRKPGRPFCLMVHHKAPHGPLIADAKHAAMYEDAALPEPRTLHDDLGTRPTAASLDGRSFRLEKCRYLGKKPPAGLQGKARRSWYYQQYFKGYLRLVASLDDNVGRLLDYLDSAGLADGTVVVYTSDNGFFLGDHGWFNKMWMYEESLRMPLLVRYRPEITRGAVNGDIALNLDFGPTLLDYAGVATPEEMQGRSLRPLLQGRTPRDWRPAMYYHYFGQYGVSPHVGVRTRRHKLLHFYQTDAWELFDLEKDPHELRNVHDDPAYAAVVRELKAELARLRAEFRDAGPAGGHPDFALVRDAQVTSTRDGYAMRGGSDGVALRKLSAPLKKKAVLRATVRSLRTGGRQNGFLTFGPDADPDHLVHAGIYMKAGEYVVIRGKESATRDDNRTRRPATFDPKKAFEVVVEVDIEARRVTMTVDGTELRAPLPKRLEAIAWVGFAAHNASTTFSRLDLKGE